MSPRELQGRYTVALERIDGKAGSGDGDRNKPIYRGSSQMTEQQAIDEAAKALTALWKIGRAYKA